MKDEGKQVWFFVQDSSPDISSRRAGPPPRPRPRPPRGGSSTSCGWWRTARAGWPPEPDTVSQVFDDVWTINTITVFPLKKNSCQQAVDLLWISPIPQRFLKSESLKAIVHCNNLQRDGCIRCLLWVLSLQIVKHCYMYVWVRVKSVMLM